MSEHSMDDPVGADPAAGSAGEHLADDTVVSEETGARYRPDDGAVASTPEDDERLLEEQEEEL